MGWGRFFFLGNWGQQFDIEDHKHELAILKQKMRLRTPLKTTIKLNQRIKNLEKENVELRSNLTSLIHQLSSNGIIEKDGFVSLVKPTEPEENI